MVRMECGTKIVFKVIVDIIVFCLVVWVLSMVLMPPDSVMGN